MRKTKKTNMTTIWKRKKKKTDDKKKKMDTNMKNEKTKMRH